MPTGRDQRRTFGRAERANLDALLLDGTARRREGGQIDQVASTLAQPADPMRPLAPMSMGYHA